MNRTLLVSILAISALLAGGSVATADTLVAGSYIIPMDTDYQDDGMLKAYGLVYQLLLNDVPIRWCIKPGKAHNESDFTASATDVASAAVVTDHAYRGGPFAVDSADAAVALPIITAWQAANTTAVHEATTSFDCEVSRLLVNAPTIAMVADGNQKIARKYMQAAGIPDSTGDLAWPDSSPDMLDPTELAGPTSTNHADGELFGSDGKPVYCQLMSMHWGVNDAQANPEVVAEVRQFLNYPTHFFAECQAVNAYENHANGRFLTPNGFVIDSRPTDVDFYNSDQPFAQLDGDFATVGGSEPSYTLPAGDTYKAQDITMLTRLGTAQGDGDVWMTGYLDGVCPPNVESCSAANFGKISYLAGHEYDTKLPISSNPKTQGARLFLNSLFEAPCATAGGQPDISLGKYGPATTDVDTVTWTIEVNNVGVSVAQNVIVRDTLPPGTLFVSATNGGQLVGNEVVWDRGNVALGEFASLQVTVQLGGEGTYDNTAAATYMAGNNQKQSTSNTVSTVYCMGDTDMELCTAAAAQCGPLMVSDRCGVARTVNCDAGVCDANASCDPSNTCVCDSGWQGTGMSCANIDECLGNVAGCDVNATCADSPGSFSCTCNAGYFGSGFFCTLTDECATSGNCDANATCDNAPGGFTCTCNAGYAGNGQTCADIDECAGGFCDPVAACTNSVGGYTCVCPAGYSGDGITCVDIDECASGAAGCDALATCTNTPGGFDCACPAGYSGDGTVCADIDECVDGTDNCVAPAVCANTDGSFDCSCPAGFNTIGAACLDIDECVDQTHDCAADETCVNTPGGFDCGCGPGFALDAGVCADIDECAAGMDDCGESLVCSNLVGSFECVCATGFVSANGVCEDIDECADGFDDCDANATCTNTDGSFDCVCNQGYDGDGRTCSPSDSLCTLLVCGDNQVCEGGTCVALCNEDADCNDQESCVNDRCVGDPCADVVCADAKVCRDGGDCVSVACDDGSQCGTGEVCLGGVCSPGGGTTTLGAEGGCGCSSASGGIEDGWLALLGLLAVRRRRR